MSRITPGDAAPPFTLPAMSGESFDLQTLSGQAYFLSFLRYASCPFCNLRMHELATRRAEIGSAFPMVAVFNSELSELQRHATKHEAGFPILADPDRIAYDAWRVERSMAGALLGAVTKMPSMISGLLRYGMPTELTTASLNMPADFLVGPDGIVHTAHYGQDEGDHLPFEQIAAFAGTHAPPSKS